MESPVKAHMAPPFPPHPQPQMTHTKAKERRRKAEEGDDDHHEHKLLLNLTCKSMADKGRPLPKFGEWDVNDPSSAEGFTVIFNKARNEKKGGGVSDSPRKDEHPGYNKHGHVLGKPTKKWLCCMKSTRAE